MESQIEIAPYALAAMARCEVCLAVCELWELAAPGLCHECVSYAPLAVRGPSEPEN